jgi:hypothetical protein
MDGKWERETVPEGKPRCKPGSPGTLVCVSCDFAHDSAQLLDVAQGLEYMHSLKIAHLDLKGVRSFNFLRCLQKTDKCRRRISLSRTRSVHASQISACRGRVTTLSSQLLPPPPAVGRAVFILQLRNFWPTKWSSTRRNHRELPMI